MAFFLEPVNQPYGEEVGYQPCKIDNATGFFVTDESGNCLDGFDNMKEALEWFPTAVIHKTH